MPVIRLLSFDLRRIVALDEDATRIDGIPVVDGALPPMGLLENAARALIAGGPARWFSPFAFVDEAGRIVGAGGFKGLPVDGAVELGYHVAPTCRGQGHATRGVLALVDVAFAQETITAVVAETALSNVASRRVVEKAGFVHAGRGDSPGHGAVDRWRRERH